MLKIVIIIYIVIMILSFFIGLLITLLGHKKVDKMTVKSKKKHKDNEELEFEEDKFSETNTFVNDVINNANNNSLDEEEIKIEEVNKDLDNINTNVNLDNDDNVSDDTVDLDDKFDDFYE